MTRNLTDAQLNEFPNGPLADFAAAWLEFQRSSPCTTEKASFRYFSAPKTDDMSEHDVLYGPDRNAAYRKLIWSFRRCQRQRLFDRYFGQGHTKYYESQSVKGLVLLSQWTQEQIPMPGLYDGPGLPQRPEDYDEIWLAVPAGKPYKNPVGNVRIVPELAAPDDIMTRFYAEVKSGHWDESSFYGWFAPAWLRSLLNPAARAMLSELAARTGSEAMYLAAPGRGEPVPRSVIRLALDAMGGPEHEKENAKNADNDKPD